MDKKVGSGEWAVDSKGGNSEVYKAIREALAVARESVVIAVNSAMVGVYWEIGKHIYDDFPIWHTLRAKLSWSNYRLLVQSGGAGE